MSSFGKLEFVVNDLITACQVASHSLNAASFEFQDPAARSTLSQVAAECSYFATSLKALAIGEGFASVKQEASEGFHIQNPFPGQGTVKDLGGIVIGAYQHALQTQLSPEIRETVQLQFGRVNSLYQTLAELPGGSTIIIPIGGE